MYIEHYDDSKFYVYNPATISYDECSPETDGCLSGKWMNEARFRVAYEVMRMWFDDEVQ